VYAYKAINSTKTKISIKETSPDTSNDGNFLRIGLRSSSNPVVPPLMGTRLLFFSMIWDWKLSRLL